MSHITKTEQLEQDFLSALQNEQALDFFFALTEQEQKSLRSYCIDLRTKPDISKDNYNSVFLATGAMSISAHFLICATQIFSFREYEQHFHIVPKDYFDSHYFKIYRPVWLQEYLDKECETLEIWYFRILRYAYIIPLMQCGYTFSTESIAYIFVNSNKYRCTVRNKYIFDIAHHTDFTLTLEEHFWLIFSYPSNIQSVSFSKKLTSNAISDKNSWFNIIKKHINAGRIDRQRVLRECLLTSTRNLNKVETGWFFDVFTHLKPTHAEIKLLVPELLITLNCVQTKPVNTTLKVLKSLATDNDFCTDDFLAVVPVLLSSEVKVVINNTFAVLEQLAKTHANNKERHAELCALACHTLIHNDEMIQSKTAKFLIKYGNAEDSELTDAITCYYEGVFSAVQQLLSEYFVDLVIESTEEEKFEFTKVDYLHPDNIIELPIDFDDQIFFITQAFENNEVYHFDMYLEVIKQLVPKINADTIASLAPALKNAQFAIQRENNRQGNIEKLMAIQFINISKKLHQKFTCNDIGKIIEKIENIDIPYHKGLYGKRYSNELEKMPIHTEHANRIFTEFLCYSKQSALQQCKKTNTSPLLTMLSTPTHSPCFIDIAVLCQRLQTYQNHNISVNATDFQIAISRLVLPTTMTQNIEHTLTGEYADIIEYLTANTVLDVGKCQTLPLWTIALYRKGQSNDLDSFIKHFELTADLAMLSSTIQWSVDISIHHYDNETCRTTQLRTTDSGGDCDDGNTNLDDYELTDDTLFIYHQYFYKSRCFTLVDTTKLFSVTPFNPHLPLIQSRIIDRVSHGGSFSIEVDAIYTVDRTIPLLMSTWQKDYEDGCYLFLACVLQLGKKSCTQMGGELWLKAVQENNMDSERLGNIMGTLAYDEFTPLKRFTDLINEHLINISSVHNSDLVTLISNMIAHMNDTPIKGTKKLLELYLELLTITHSPLPHMAKNKLTRWNETKSLKAIIKKLEHLA